MTSRETNGKLPGWLLAVFGSLLVAAILGSYHLVSRLIVLETQVTENKKDREKQFDRLEGYIERELDDLDEQIDELEEEVRDRRKE